MEPCYRRCLQLEKFLNLAKNVVNTTQAGLSFTGGESKGHLIFTINPSKSAV